MTRMIGKITISLIALVIGVGLFAVIPASAQGSTAPTWQESTSEHHQWIYRIMKDMTDVMGKMTEQMSGTLTPDQRLQMARRMERMAMMMRRLSGLEARPALSGSEWQKRTDRMRKQMDEMLRDSRMTPHG